MKLLIISDIHGSVFYTKKLVEIYKKIKPDKVIILGDILYSEPRNSLLEDNSYKNVVELLNSLKDNILAIKGNCDTKLDQIALNFDISTSYRILTVDGYNFILTHGHLNYELPELGEKDILLNGHTHIYKLEDKYINPGSISKPRVNKEHTFIIYENKIFNLYDIDMNLINSLRIK